MEIKETLKKFFQGKIKFDNFMLDFFDNTITYFGNKIHECKFKKFLPYYVECYLYFCNLYKTDSSYDFHYKQLILEFKKIKNINSFFKYTLKGLNSKIIRMDFVYKHMLTMYYVFFDEIPENLNYIFYMYQLVLDSTLDKIYGGVVDDFILRKILELTDAKKDYYEKLECVEKLVSEYFKAHQNVEFSYELKGLWPMDEYEYPLKYVSNKDGVFVFIDSNGKQISLSEETLGIHCLN